MNSKDYYPWEKSKKLKCLTKDELAGKIIKEVADLKPKKYSYLSVTPMLT